jgi:hypothetical protein
MRCLLLILALALGAQSAPLEDDYPTYVTKYYNQTLDHFDPANSARFAHRYLFNDDYWTGDGALANGCRGPILLYTGNEGDITGFWGSNGFMVQDLAPDWGALLVFPEERYYGESLPFGDASFDVAENRVFLSTSQAGIPTPLPCAPPPHRLSPPRRARPPS